MTDKTDFSRLYRELDIEPEAGIDAFQRAYRRSLKRLHPDTGQTRADAETVDLSWLVRDYRRALAFHDANGRLPGASIQVMPEQLVGTQCVPHPSSPMPPAQANLSGISPFSRWMQVLVIVTMVVIGIGLLLP